MADGKRSEEWAYWSHILALTANCHRDPKKTKAFKPMDFHPYFARKKSAGDLKTWMLGFRSLCSNTAEARLYGVRG